MSATKGIYDALMLFQSSPPHIELDARNPHFRSKYASLPGINAAVLPRLNEVGIVVTQPLSMDENGTPTLITRLTHASTGEFIQHESPLTLVKNDPQAKGSAVTYERRYQLLSMLGLVGDEDDDGNAATPRPKPADDIPFGEAPAPAFAPPGDLASDKQVKMLNVLVAKCVNEGVAMANGEPFTVEALRAMMQKAYGVTSKKELAKSQASDLITRLKTLAKEDE